MAFFEASELPNTKALPFLVPHCGACGLFRECNSPKMPVSGDGKRGILVCAEAPGIDEDRQGTQLIGEAGKYLRSTMGRFGVDLDQDCWKTNSIICYPGDRNPTAKEVDYCRPNLTKTIKDLNPRVILTFGGPAIQSLLEPFWKDSISAVTPWVGWKIPFQRFNCWIAPNYHPSYVLSSENAKNGKAIKVWFERYLEQSLQLEGRPWDPVPDYGNEVEIVYDPDEAARILRKFIADGGAVSFDYETNRLKPDVAGAEIVCCAVCWRGKRTIAYPWVGGAIKATSELLLSGLPKIGANDKFETRWTRTILRHDVRNWVWDVMLGGHFLDNRRGITSVKFQLLCRLGLEDYSSDIEPYLSSDDGRGFNSIRKVNIRKLLLYNGIDALGEFKLAECQRREMRKRQGVVW